VSILATAIAADPSRKGVLSSARRASVVCNHTARRDPHHVGADAAQQERQRGCNHMFGVRHTSIAPRGVTIAVVLAQMCHRLYANSVLHDRWSCACSMARLHSRSWPYAHSGFQRMTRTKLVKVCRSAWKMFALVLVRKRFLVSLEQNSKCQG